MIARNSPNASHWSDVVSQVQDAYNDTVHSTTGLPPRVAFYVALHEKSDTIDPAKLPLSQLQHWVDKFDGYDSLRLEVTHVLKVYLP